jgi:hypothetical protein
MALLDENNLQARIEQARKHRVNHVGTKLNHSELRAFEALCEKREQTASELIRTLIQRELRAEETGPIPSPELVEIISARLFLMNMLKPLIVSGERLPEEGWNSYLEKIGKQKYGIAEDALKRHAKAKPQSKS